jgi:8-oxo-dGTP diphosphatase
MKLFYGTGNSSKLRNMRALLEGLPIELISPLEYAGNLPEIPENGNTPWDNAKDKAMIYHKLTGMPSMGLDSGLYIEGLSLDEQPGTHVRRVGGRTLTDIEFIEHYSSIAKQHGGKVRARFINGLCVVADENRIKCAGGPHISTDWFWIVAEPHAIKINGFPMDSIAVDPKTMTYWVEADLEHEQTAKGVGLTNGIRRFFMELLEENYISEIMEDEDYAGYDKL